MSRVLILGANGMLGHVVLRMIAANHNYEVIGVVRSSLAARMLSNVPHARVVVSGSLDNSDTLLALFDELRPDVVVNCIGLVKQLAHADDPLVALPINAMLPHRLAKLCALSRARLVHVSTDCVFSGVRGDYTEDDIPDPQDIYGRSKLLGEVIEPCAITLRTSIIGPELGTPHGLVGWFLAQEGRCKGFTKAIFSGLPTVELGRIIRDIILPHSGLSGLYHVASDPISKHDLLELIAQQYGKYIEIIPDNEIIINRSLNANRFQQATGYAAPSWPELVRLMYLNG